MEKFPEEMLQNEEPLLIDISGHCRIYRCAECGNKPKTGYWGARKILMRCENCKGDYYVGKIKKDEKSLIPAIRRAIDSWNKDNPLGRYGRTHKEISEAS